MKLIIDISEKTYKEIRLHGLYLCPTYYHDLEKALKEAKELKINDINLDEFEFQYGSDAREILETLLSEGQMDSLLW